jgi:hypothetical protein
MQHISEIGLMKKLLREAKADAVTPAKQKLLDAAAAIRQYPTNADEAFMARHLVQCTLPHSDPGDVERWTRRNDNLAQRQSDARYSAGVGFSEELPHRTSLWSYSPPAALLDHDGGGANKMPPH